jgi:hypothetical protein
MTIPFLILVLASFLFNKKIWREKVFLLIWFLVPFLALGIFGKVIYPRFILFMTVSLLVLGTFTLYQIAQIIKIRWLKVLIVFVFLMQFIITDYNIMTDFNKAEIPQDDKAQFLQDWPSGVGVKETVEFLTEKAKNGKIFVGTEGTFGLMPYALEIYLHNNKNIAIKSYFWELKDTPPKEVIDASKKMPTYFVFYEPGPSVKVIGEAPPSWPVKEIFQIKKLEKDTYYTLYEIHP